MQILLFKIKGDVQLEVCCLVYRLPNIYASGENQRFRWHLRYGSRLKTTGLSIGTVIGIVLVLAALIVIVILYKCWLVQAERDELKLKGEELKVELEASKEREKATTAVLNETQERLEVMTLTLHRGGQLDVIVICPRCGRCSISKRCLLLRTIHQC